MKSFKGSYCIIYYAETAFGVRIGKSGLVDISPGYIAYCGSAMGAGGVVPRVGRHLSSQANKRWHIDYITQYLSPVKVWTVRDKNLECEMAEILSDMKTAEIAAQGFGSSDCGCAAHLLRFRVRPHFTVFKRELKKKCADVSVVSRSITEFGCQTS